MDSNPRPASAKAEATAAIAAVPDGLLDAAFDHSRAPAHAALVDNNAATVRYIFETFYDGNFGHFYD